MALKLITAPTVEPVTMALAKEHCKIPTDVTDEDTWLTNKIVGARRWFEGHTHRQLCTATWDEYFDDFCPDAEGIIRLQLPPLQSITHVKYYDADDTLQTWTSTLYQVDAVSEPARLKYAYGQSYPSVRGGKMNAVVVRMVSGYGAAADVPQDIRDAILRVVSLMNEIREDSVTGTIISQLGTGGVMETVRRYWVPQSV